MNVWLIESGEYEQRCVDGVADSLESAIAYLKGVYGPPHIVKWGEPVKLEDGRYEIVGQFASVPNHSTRHDCAFEIWETRLNT